MKFSVGVPVMGWTIFSALVGWMVFALPCCEGVTSEADITPFQFNMNICRNASLHVGALAAQQDNKRRLTSSHYLMTSKCPDDYDVTDVKEKCKVLSPPTGTFDCIIPVTSTQNNVTYANKFCAMCHGQAESLITWSLNVTCREYLDVTDASTAGRVFQMAIDSPACTVELWAPSGVAAVPCGPFALPHHDLELPPLSILLDFNPQTALTPLTQGNALPSPSKCKVGQWLNPLKDTCLPLHCWEGKRLTEDGYACRSVVSTVKGLVYRLALTFTPAATSAWQDPTCSWQDAIAERARAWPSLLGSEQWRVGVAGKVSPELSAPQLLAALEFALTYPAPRDTVEATAVNLTHTPVAVTCGSGVVRFNASPYLDELDFPLDIGTTGGEDISVFEAVYGQSPNPPQPIIISDLLLCPYVILHDGDFQYDINTGEIHLLSNLPLVDAQVDIQNGPSEDAVSSTSPYNNGETNAASTSRRKSLTLDPGSFVMEPSGSVKVCLKALDDLCKKHFQADVLTPSVAVFNVHKEVQKYLSFACTLLSLAGLILTFLTYCLFPTLRTLPAKNNMCLIVNLFLAQGLTEFGIARTDHAIVCVVLGVLIHYFWLAAIFWMNICSFHMFRVFTSKQTRSPIRSSDRLRLVQYLAYAQGVPLAIITATMSSSIATVGHLGYGGRTCYLATPLLVGVAFALPLGLVLLANAVFFTLATWAIGSTVRPLDKGKEGSSWHNLLVYIRLSSVTGLFWTTGLLAEAFHLEALHYVSVVFNGAQGLLLALAYVTTTRVLSLYREKLASLAPPPRNVPGPPDVASVNGTTTYDSGESTLSTRV